MRADEIFNVTFKFFVHWLVPAYLLTDPESVLDLAILAARSKFQCSRLSNFFYFFVQVREFFFTINRYLENLRHRYDLPLTMIQLP